MRLSGDAYMSVFLYWDEWITSGHDISNEAGCWPHHRLNHIVSIMYKLIWHLKACFSQYWVNYNTSLQSHLTITSQFRKYMFTIRRAPPPPTKPTPPPKKKKKKKKHQKLWFLVIGWLQNRWWDALAKREANVHNPFMKHLFKTQGARIPISPAMLAAIGHRFKAKKRRRKLKMLPQGSTLEYCCHIWAGAPACHLSLFKRVQKHIVNLVGEELGSSLQPLSHRRSVASLCLFYIYFHGKCATSVSDPVPPVGVFERETRLSACSHPYTLALPRCRTKSYSNSFFPRTASLWNSLPGACFPPSYNLDCFKRNINSYLQLPWVIFIFNVFLLVAPYHEWLLALFGANLH